MFFGSALIEDFDRGLCATEVQQIAGHEAAKNGFILVSRRRGDPKGKETGVAKVAHLMVNFSLVKLEEGEEDRNGAFQGGFKIGGIGAPADRGYQSHQVAVCPRTQDGLAVVCLRADTGSTRPALETPRTRP